MNIKIINDKKEFYSSWEKITVHPLQSWLFGQAREEQGTRVLRIGQFKENKLKNIYQISLHPLFFNYKIGYLPRSLFPSKEVLSFLIDYGKKNNLIFIKIEPYVLKEDLQFPIFNFQPNSKYLILKSKHPLFPQWTQMIDLKKNEDELFKNLHHKTRYNIRLAQKKGVVVRQMDNDEGFAIFIKLYFETCRRQKYHGHNYRYHQIIWKNFKEKIAHILIAFYQDIPLAAYQLWFYKKRLYYVYGGSSDQYRHLMASNLLMWEAICFGIKLKAEIFDLWGSLPPDYSSAHPWAGFTRFKQGYGGKFVQFVGSYDLVINPFLYQLYTLAYPVRQFLLKFL